MSLPKRLLSDFVRFMCQGLFISSFQKRLIPFLLIFIFQCSSGWGQVVINELGIAPTGNTNGSGGEFIELLNKSNAPADIGCYVLLFSGTSGAGNPTGWTVTIPSGTTIGAGEFYLIGGLGRQSPVGQTWTNLPVGGTPWVNAYGANGRAVDLDLSTTNNTAVNSTNPGNFNDGTGGQLTLLNSSGIVITSIAFKNGNNAGSYPAFSNASPGCSPLSPINNPGPPINYVSGSFSSSGYNGISLSPSGLYKTNASLTPGLANIVLADCSITLASGAASPTLCINNTLTPIVYNIGSDATGADVTGLPNGVNGTFANNVVTIGGTPTESGTFSYTVTLTGSSCTNVSVSGTITVNPVNTITLSSAAGTDAQSVCINTAITNITYATTGATGASFSGLPAGVSGSFNAGVVTISGTPTAATGSPFNYSILLTGGCGSVNATGTITVTAANTVGAASSTPTLCINTALAPNITHTTTGATGIGAATGLPAGVTAAWASNTITISGTPTASGTFNYTIPLTGGCGSVNATGTITVTAANTVGAAS
ncbi:lamin tail domain-containing protein, partial [Flavisolibacter ginsengisoli]